MKTIQLAGGFVILRDGEFECFAGLLALKASWAQFHWAGTWILSLVNGLFTAFAWAWGAEGKIRPAKNPNLHLNAEAGPRQFSCKSEFQISKKWLQEIFLCGTNHWVVLEVT